MNDWGMYHSTHTQIKQWNMEQQYNNMRQLAHQQMAVPQAFLGADMAAGVEKAPQINKTLLLLEDV